MSTPYVSQLYVYPVKSARGIPLDTAHLDGRGIHLDRRWMLVDSDARFLTQREIPRLSLIQVESLPTHLRITGPAMPSLTVPLIPPERKPLTVIVWKDAV
ncbi:MAG TPA: MOSC domain-containing protein, partial [Bacteroidota bacterium]|nr:MOSC domain-containing protein [Bacteroidota bacterium]